MIAIERAKLEQVLEALEWFTAAEQGDEPPINEAITAIKEALAQPEQEPVEKYSDIISDGGLDPRNTTPPKRPWVGLKPEDYDAMRPRVPYMVNDFTFADVAAIVEAKLKEKNA